MMYFYVTAQVHINRSRSYKAGLVDVSGSCDALFVYGYSQLYDAVMARVPVKLEFGEKTTGDILNTSLEYYSGNFILTSFKHDASDQENASYSVTFKHSSAWSKVISDYYYVSESGSDATGDGSYAAPWATLYKATDEVTDPDSTIYIMPGTYVETTQSALAPGVSILGAGDTSIITTATDLSPIILLSSVAEGTNGNQSIANSKPAPS